MPDNTSPFEISLSDLRPAQWVSEIRELGDVYGFYESLGKKHHGLFIETGDTLLVSFETLPGIQALSDSGRPVGFDLAHANGWSNLSVISAGDTWFRDRNVYGFFDQLTDDGFFEEFDRVIFYGAGPCGYAAAAFSVAAPGATVLVLEPQATLDPRMTEWDDRFVEMRRTDFTDRYGYAPDMLEASGAAFVVYDPAQQLDAMHATLFERKGVTRLRARHLGSGMQSHFEQMGILTPLVSAAGKGTLTEAEFARLYRKRRDYARYCKKLVAACEEKDRLEFAETVCSHICENWHAPRYRRKLKSLRRTLSEDGSSDDD